MEISAAKIEDKIHVIAFKSFPEEFRGISDETFFMATNGTEFLSVIRPEVVYDLNSDNKLEALGLYCPGDDKHKDKDICLIEAETEELAQEIVGRIIEAVKEFNEVIAART